MVIFYLAKSRIKSSTEHSIKSISQLSAIQGKMNAVIIIKNSIHIFVYLYVWQIKNLFYTLISFSLVEKLRSPIKQY